MSMDDNDCHNGQFPLNAASKYDFFTYVAYFWITAFYWITNLAEETKVIYQYILNMNNKRILFIHSNKETHHNTRLTATEITWWIKTLSL